MAKKGITVLITGTKVKYLDRVWSVIGLDPIDDRCHEIIADNGRRLTVFTDLLQPIFDEEMTEGSWDIVQLAKQVRQLRARR